MKLVPGYMLRNVADYWVAIPVGKISGEAGHMIALSESSALLWKLLEKGADKAELVEAILANYEVDRAVAENDIDSFISELEQENLFERENFVV